jgi:hypothetical protein
VGWKIQKNRLRREEQKKEMAAQRVTADEAMAAEAATVDFAALHRSLNEKKKVVRILTRFARELAGERTALEDANIL